MQARKGEVSVFLYFFNGLRQCSLCYSCQLGLVVAITDQTLFFNDFPFRTMVKDRE